ncbi:UPF0336 protein [Longispora fulva]|uniref:Acyl dehydratase n=1 Tax=Longispora fulva TaxID=619741 RepID=A0A8J7GHL9_9ACTN|nr:MaoC family dehydratase N-terminal domain-containing protein [Longispora fulva]MBG6136448.1 acyl dehydratase [Longispora fulva]GIG59615.1 UPF0336 protein [Longispora fulva]
MKGRVYPATPPYAVSRERIRAFADAIGDPSPVYRDPVVAAAFGYPDVLAPPTFPVVFTTEAGRPVLADLGAVESDVLHTGQRLEYHRPVRAGDNLTCTVVVTELRSVGEANMVTIRTDVATVEGEAVLSEYTTLLVKS